MSAAQQTTNRQQKIAGNQESSNSTSHVGRFVSGLSRVFSFVRAMVGAGANTVAVRSAQSQSAAWDAGRAMREVKRAFAVVALVSEVALTVLYNGAVDVRSFLQIQPVQAAAGIARVVNYQGRLMDAAGLAVADGSYQIKFSIYNQTANGTRLWSASTTNGTPTDTPKAVSVTVKNGLFSVLLGDTSTNQVAFPEGLFNNDALYLGVTVGTDSEMTPRKRLSAVPYAYNSDALQGQHASGTVSSSGGNLFALRQNTANGALANRTTLGVYTSGTSNVFDYLIRGNNGSDVFTVNRQGNVTTTGNLQANGNTFLGNNSTTDRINVASRFVSDLTPATNLTYSLGSSSLRWKNLYASYVSSTTIEASNYVSTTALYINGTAVTSSVPTLNQVALKGNVTSKDLQFGGGTSTRSFRPGTDASFNLGSATNRWRNIFVSNGVYSSTTVVSPSSLFTNATTTNLNVVSRVTSDLIANSTSRNLGSATARWGSLFSNNVYASGTLQAASMLLWGNATHTGNIMPSITNTYSLGNTNYRWKGVWAVGVTSTWIGAGTVSTTNLYLNGVAVTSSVPTWQQVTNKGATTNRWVQFAGATSTNDIKVSGGVKLAAAHSTSAGMVQYSGSDFLGYDGTAWRSLTNVANVRGEATGFPGTSYSTTSFNNGTRTFSISPTGASFDYYYRGAKFTKTGTDTVTIPDTEGEWNFYYNATNTLMATQYFPGHKNAAFVANIYWDATNNIAIIRGEERHGLTMDADTATWIHNTIGTRYNSGLTLSYTAGTGGLPADAQVAITGGVIYDEDLKHTIVATASPANNFEQNLGLAAPFSPAQIPVYYRSGASGNWRKTTSTGDYPVFSISPNLISYNNTTNWTTPAASNGYFVAMWLIATNNVREPVIAILGQRQDSILADARSNNTYDALSFGSVPFQEMKVLYRVIYETKTSFGNAVKARIVDVQDLRSISNMPSGTYVATAHSSLSGLTSDDHTQYLLLAGRSGGQVANGGTAAGDDLTLDSTANVSKGSIFMQPNGGAVQIGSNSNQSLFTLMVAGNVGPSSTNAYDLGSSAYRWRNLYANTVFATNTYSNNATTSYLAVSSRVTSDLIANSTSRNLGTSASRWGSLFLNGNLYATGTVQGATLRVYGAATTSGNVMPSADLAYGLGNANYRWKYAYLGNVTSTNLYNSGTVSTTKLYVNGVQVTGASSVPSWQQVTNVGATTNRWIKFAGATSVGNVMPSSTLTYDLGSSNYRWKDIWASSTRIGTSTWELWQGNTGFMLSKAFSKKLQISNAGTLLAGSNDAQDVGSSSNAWSNAYVTNFNAYTVSTSTLAGTYNTAGTAYDTAIQGKYAYVADYGYLRVIDISNPANQVETGSVALANAYDVEVMGKYAFVSGNGNIYTVNISNPSSPQLVATKSVGGATFRIAVSGNNLYVTNYWDGFRIYDITNPLSPVLIKTIASASFNGGYCYDVAVQGSYAYVAAGNGGMGVVNIADPNNATVVGTYDTAGTSYYIDIAGRYAYVGDYTSGLAIIDVKNPASPALAKQFTAAGTVYGVAIAGNYLYAQSSASGLNVIDVSSSTNPAMVAKYGVAGTDGTVKVAGKYAYVSAGASGLKIFNISGLTAPSASIGSIATNNLVVTNKLNVDNFYSNNVIVGNDTQLIGRLGVYSTATFLGKVGVNTTNPNRFNLQVAGNIGPDAANTYNLGSSSGSWSNVYANTLNAYVTTTPTLVRTLDTAGTAQGVVVKGKYAYVADATYLRIIDISNASYPKETGSIAAAGARDVFVSGNYAYVSSDTNGDIYLIDVSNPSSPQLVSTIAGPYVSFGLDVYGKYLYVANYWGGLNIYDISNPVSPTLVKNVVLPGDGDDVMVQGNYAYVAAGSGGLSVVNVSNPANASIVASADTPNWASNVFVAGRYAYVNDTSGAMVVVDISNPATPTIVKTTSFTNIYGMYLAGDYLYAHKSSVNPGLYVINVSSSTNPTLASYYSSAMVGTYGAGLVVDGRYAYVPNGGTGLQIFALPGVYAPTANIGAIASNDIDVTGRISATQILGMTMNLGGNAHIEGYLNAVSTSTLMGNVGIGTSSPTSSKLVVAGNVNPSITNTYSLGSSSYRWLNLWAKNATFTSLYVNGSQIGPDTLQTVTNNGKTTTNDIQFAGGTSTRRFAILGSRDQSQLLVRANATQSNTNPLIKFENSAGTLIGGIHADANSTLFMGYQAGNSNTIGSGTDNYYIGYQAGYTNTTGDQNIAIGTSALYSNNNTQSRNIAIGYNSLNGPNSYDNTIIGHNAARNASLGAENVGVGNNVLYNNQGLYNVAIGKDSMYGNGGAGNAYSNTAVGYRSLYSVTTGYENVAIGINSLLSNQTGYDNIAIGVSALNSGNGASFRYNTAIGHQAAAGSVTGELNSAYGYQALNQLTSGGHNVGVGSSALYRPGTGSYNTAVGDSALYGAGANYSYNSAVGYQALRNVNANGNYNTAVGVNAGYSGTALSTETYNTFLGTDSGLGAAGVNYSTAIGYNARVNRSQSVVIGNSNDSVGIGVSYPYLFKLTVAGNVGPTSTATYNLGNAATRWLGVYASNLYASSSVQGATLRAYATGTVTDLVVSRHVGSDLMPWASQTYSLGDSTHQWKNAFFSGTVTTTKLYVNGTLITGTTPNLQQVTDQGKTTTNDITFKGGTSTGSFRPSINNSFSLGSSALSWRNVYSSSTIYSGNANGTGNIAFATSGWMYANYSGGGNNSAFVFKNNSTISGGALFAVVDASNNYPFIINEQNNINFGSTNSRGRITLYGNSTRGGDADFAFSVTTTNSSDYARWLVGVDKSDGYKFKISSSTNGGTNLGTNDRFVIDGNGNIGINTSTPTSAKMVVAGDINPSITNTYSLGSSSYRWLNLWAKNATFTSLYVNGTQITGAIPTLQQVTDQGKTTTNDITFKGGTSTGSFRPSANNTFSLGSAANSWKNIYVSSTIYLGAASGQPNFQFATSGWFSAAPVYSGGVSGVGFAFYTRNQLNNNNSIMAVADKDFNVGLLVKSATTVAMAGDYRDGFAVTMGGNAGPYQNNLYDLGSTSYRWRNLYNSNVYASSSVQGATLRAYATGTVTDLVVSRHVGSDLMPWASQTYSLGDSTHQWKNAFFSGSVTTTNLYASGYVSTTNLYVNGVSAGNFFKQGGNNFGTSAILGTNDGQSLIFETANTNRLTLDVAGTLFPNVNNSYNLGKTTNLFKTIYASYVSTTRIDAARYVSTTNLTVNGSTILGNASNDLLTINGNAVTIPNDLNFDSNTLIIDAANNDVTIGGKGYVWNTLDVGDGMIGAPSSTGYAILLTRDGGDSFLETQSTDSSEGMIMHGGGSEGNYGLIRNIGGTYAQHLVNTSGLFLFTEKTSYDDPILMLTAGAERMRIAEDGNIGINDSTPTEGKLVLAGSSNAPQFFIKGALTQRPNQPLIVLATSTGATLTSITANTVDSLFIGSNAGSKSNGTGAGSYFIGNNAGANVTSGYWNIALGSNALQYLTTNGNNTAIGSYAANLVTGSDNVAIGMQTMRYSTTNNYNTAVGSISMTYNTTGGNNTALGYATLYRNKSATSTVAIGYQAGYGSNWYANQYSTYLGSEAGYSALTGSNNNTMIGYRSGYANTSGANNLFVGYQAGDNVTTGSNNIVIGYDVNARSATASYQLNIGNNIYGDLQNNRIGIGVPYPYTAKLVIAGDVYPSSTNAYDLGSTTYRWRNLWAINATFTSLYVNGAAITPAEYFKQNGNSFGTTAVLGTNDANHLVVETNNTSRIMIYDTGNVGIGTDTPDNFKLEVAGNVGPDASLTYDLGSSSYRWKDLWVSSTYIGGATWNIRQNAGNDLVIAPVTYPEIFKMDYDMMQFMGTDPYLTIKTIDDSTATLEFRNSSGQLGYAGFSGNDFNIINNSGSNSLYLGSGGTAQVMIDTNSMDPTSNDIITLGESNRYKKLNAKFVSTTRMDASVYVSTTLLTANEGNFVPLNTSSFTQLNATNTGGTPFQVVVDGRYTYIANSPKAGYIAIIADAEKGAYASTTGSLALNAVSVNITSLAVQGDYVYALTGSGIFYSANVSDKSKPVLADFATFGSSNYSHIAINGGYAYVTDYSANTMRVIRIADPYNLELVTSIATNSTGPEGIATQGNYVYTANYSGQTITAFDVSNPEAPVRKSVSPSLGTSVNAIAVQGRYAYVMSYSGTKLLIVDISSSTSMKLVKSLTTTGNTYDFATIYAAGRYLYVPQTDARVAIFDIQYPNNARQVGYLTLGGSAYSAYVSGRYLYTLSSSGSDRLRVYDIKGIETNGLLAHSAEVGTLQVRHEAIINDMLEVKGALTVGNGAMFQAGMNVYGDLISYGGIVNRPATSVLYNPYTSVGVSGTVVRSMTAGGYQYVLGNGGTYLYVFDISNQTSTQSLASVSLAYTYQDMYVNGQYAYLLRNGGTLAGRILDIYDITNPSNPTLVNGGAVANGNNGGTNPIIKVYGTRLYTFNNYAGVTCSLATTDISDPRSTRTLSEVTISATYSCADGVIRDKYAYVLTSHDLYKYDISNPKSPSLVSSVSLAGFTPYSLDINGAYAYVWADAGSNNGSVRVYEITNSGFTFDNALTVTGAGQGQIRVMDNYAYVVTKTTTSNAPAMHVVDVSNPTFAKLVYTKSLSDLGMEVAFFDISGDALYLSPDVRGRIYPIDLKGIKSHAASIGSIETKRINVKGDAGVEGVFTVYGGSSLGGKVNMLKGGSANINGEVDEDVTTSAPYNNYAITNEVFSVIDGRNMTYSDMVDTSYAYKTALFVAATGTYSLGTGDNGRNVGIAVSVPGYVNTGAGMAGVGIFSHLNSGGDPRANLPIMYSASGYFSVDSSVSTAYGILTVSTNNNGYPTAYLMNLSSGTSARTMRLDQGCNNTTTPIFEIYGNLGGDREFYVRCDGQTYADGAYNATGADYAEYMMHDNAGFAAGDVAVIALGSASSVRMSELALRDGVVGVVSDRASVIGNVPGNNESDQTPNPTQWVTVGMLGQVPTKFSPSNGSVNVGDKLMAGDAGYAVKASGSGMVLGEALEGSGTTGTVLLYLHPHWWAGDILAADGSVNYLTSDLTAKAKDVATASNQGFDSSMFTFQGSGWDFASSAAVTTNFKLYNHTVNATTSELVIGYSTGTNGITNAKLRITNAGDVSVSGDLTVGRRLYLGNKTTGQGSTSTYIFVDDTLSPTSTYIATNADGWQASTAYDYAERYESNDDLVPGDLVTADPSGVNKVMRATTANQAILGIVSTKPGFVTGAYQQGNYPIALAGRVPTRVSTANGSIQVGDHLTVSTDQPGVAIKATGAGNVVGVALESYDKVEEGLISVFVKPGYNMGSIAQSGAQAGTIVVNQTTQQTERVEIEGLATILAGATEVHISYGTILAFPMVYGTAHASIDGSWWISNRTDKGFDIILSQAQTHDTDFTWMARPMRAGTVRFVSDNTHQTVDDLTGQPYGPQVSDILTPTTTAPVQTPSEGVSPPTSTAPIVTEPSGTSTSPTNTQTESNSTSTSP